jgi:S-formylglutathione hydrolase FrmB
MHAQSVEDALDEQPTLIPPPQLPALPTFARRDSPPIPTPADAVPTRPLRPRMIKRVLLMPREVWSLPGAALATIGSSKASSSASPPALGASPAPALLVRSEAVRSQLDPRRVLAYSSPLSSTVASRPTSAWAATGRAALSRGLSSIVSSIGGQSRRLASHLARHLHRHPATLWKLAVATGGVFLALLAAVVFYGAGLDRATSDQMVGMGFDAERGQMIAAFALALVASGASGLIVVRRGPAWLGGFLAFALTYLWPFYQQAQRSLIGPDGRPITPIAGTLDHVVLVLAALGLIFAGAGAVLGEACGQLVFPPLVTLGRHVLAALQRRRLAGPSSLTLAGRQLAAGALVALAIAVGIPEFGGLLTFGTAPQLYQPAQALAENLRGAVEQGTYVSTALGGARRTFSVYLPPSYFSVVAATQRYPVVYLLHGSPGGSTDWFSAAHAADIADALSARGLARQTIIVCPDGNGAIYHVSAWVNSFDNKQRMEDAIATDLVAYVDSHYRTLADAGDRAIGGLSEGGFGAVNIALHRPDVFSESMSLDGFYQIDNSTVAFGHGKGSQGYQHYNSPLAYLKSAEGQKAGHQIRFIIAVGKQDYFYKSGLSFVQELTAFGMDVKVIQTDGGHNWVQWGQQFGQALPVLLPVAPSHSRRQRGPY